MILNNVFYLEAIADFLTLIDPSTDQCKTLNSSTFFVTILLDYNASLYATDCM